MKQCTLCRMPASVYCASDMASLCWECDGKVHGANFLVARHSRCLLCRACRALTPWKASGPRLGPTVSVCSRCRGVADVDVMKMDLEVENDDDDDDDDLGESDDDFDGDDDDDDLGVSADELEDDEDGENQVVPWATTAKTPPPPAASSSSSDESSPKRMGICEHMVKTSGDDVDLASSQDALPCSTWSYLHYPSSRAPPPCFKADDEAASIADPICPSKDQKEVGLPLTCLRHLNSRGIILRMEFLHLLHKESTSSNHFLTFKWLSDLNS